MQKHQIGNILLSCVMGVALFSGCNIETSSISTQATPSSSTQIRENSKNSLDYNATSGETGTSIDESASVMPTPTELSDTSSESRSNTLPGEEFVDLSFLTKEQQTLYQQARDASMFLFDVTDNLDSSQFQKQINGSSVVVINGYNLYENSYRDFQNYIYGIFTSNYIESLGSLYTDKFIDYDGYLATSNDNSLIRPYVEGISRAVLDDCPDTYRLIAQDDETVQFTLISHYDNNWNTQGIMDVFTIEYPICMVNTESGWRMDEFHTTLHG